MDVGQGDEVRDLSTLELPDVGEVTRPGNGIPPWDLLLPDPIAAAACRDFLNEIHSHSADLTVRSYAFDLQRWFRFLFAVEVPWDEASPTEVTDFFVWMKNAKKSNGNQNKKRRDARISRNAVTGKKYVTDSFSKATMNHNETVVFRFYEFQQRKGKILFNPVVRGRDAELRYNAHHNPLSEHKRSSGSRTRQRGGPKRLPRSIPDELYDSFFEILGNNRDRALVAMYVSSGARPAEVLNLAAGDIDLAKGIITVTRKGGSIQEIPISWDAVAWYRLYQGSEDASAPYEPAWKTVRGEQRSLTYDALRAIFRRANQKNGTNWTPHDLRHTAATRLLAQGTPERTVQEILGHASLETLKVYTVPHFDDVVAAIRTIRNTEPKVDLPVALPYDQADMDLLFGSEVSR